MPAPAADATTPAAFNRIDLFIRWMLEGLMESCDEALREIKTMTAMETSRVPGCRHHPGRTLVIPLSGDWPQCQRLQRGEKKQPDKRAHSLPLSHTCTHGYLQFLYEHFFLAVRCIPAGSSSNAKVQK